MNQPLHERINSKIEELRPLIKEYELLSFDQKKATRHMIYMMTGGFGKSIMPVLEQWKDLEFKIASKKVIDDELRK